MRPRLFALLGILARLSLSGCQDSRPLSATPTARSLLALAGDVHESSPEDVSWAAAELARIAGRVRQAAGEARARDKDAPFIAALNEVIFGSLGFVREVDETSLRFVVLPSVLRNRRGSCVGLGTMYLALGEMLSLQIEGVLRPGHFFVRIREGAKARNVELLRQGEEMPESWYAARFPIPAGSGRAYGRGLSLGEVRGVVEFDVGNERRRQSRVAEARNAYEQSTRDFPDFGEAHASLGAMQQLLGALDEAEASYGAAQRANPGLSGLDRNIDLLKRERAAVDW
jgi:tetratricopeptide (TPR) repeat protein